LVIAAPPVADCCGCFPQDATAENVYLIVPQDILAVERPAFTKTECLGFFFELPFDDSKYLFCRKACKETHVFGFSFADFASLH